MRGFNGNRDRICCECGGFYPLTDTASLCPACRAKTAPVEVDNVELPEGWTVRQQPGATGTVFVLVRPDGTDYAPFTDRPSAVRSAWRQVPAIEVERIEIRPLHWVEGATPWGGGSFEEVPETQGEWCRCTWSEFVQANLEGVGFHELASMYRQLAETGSTDFGGGATPVVRLVVVPPSPSPSGEGRGYHGCADGDHTFDDVNMDCREGALVRCVVCGHRPWIVEYDADQQAFATREEVEASLANEAESRLEDGMATDAVIGPDGRVYRYEVNVRIVDPLPRLDEPTTETATLRDGVLTVGRSV